MVDHLPSKPSVQPPVLPENKQSIMAKIPEKKKGIIINPPTKFR
jgi:hypothetical protein